MTDTKHLTEEDRKHIRRLQALRESGIVNMYTEVKQGLYEVHGEQDGEETWQWILDNYEYYKSGDWVDVDT